MKKNRNTKMIIGKADYIKAIKIADREMNLGNGFVATNKVHKNKKAYDRKRDKRVDY
jgi:hypothetical protein